MCLCRFFRSSVERMSNLTHALAYLQFANILYDYLQVYNYRHPLTPSLTQKRCLKKHVYFHFPMYVYIQNFFNLSTAYIGTK